MRADLAAMNQGIRNANDAISMIQTADGALSVIDEKLIRMKELAEQAATGTYNSDQRLMIDSEFQAMAAEIDRIANATSFNGIHLLNGNLSGAHNGAGLVSTGAAKIHFGSGNNSAEDYYYITMGDATLYGLGLAAQGTGSGSGTGGTGGGGTGGSSVPVLGGILTNNAGITLFTSGIISFAVIPAGTKDIAIHLDCIGQNDSIEVFTRDGKHVVGTTLGSVSNTSPSNASQDWGAAGISTIADINSQVLTEANAFLPGASYDLSPLNGIGTDIPITNFSSGGAGNHFSYHGMNFGYSGDGHPNFAFSLDPVEEYLTIDEVKEDLVLLIIGGGTFWIQASWTSMPTSWGNGSGGGLSGALSISTQALAQHALITLNDATVNKDKIRAHLGAMQNRLENTIANVSIQTENLQAAESRISDLDVSAEMTTFVKNQVLTQAAVSMLSQANIMPRLALSLLEYERDKLGRKV